MDDSLVDEFVGGCDATRDGAAVVDFGHHQLLIGGVVVSGLDLAEGVQEVQQGCLDGPTRLDLLLAERHAVAAQSGLGAVLQVRVKLCVVRSSIPACTMSMVSCMFQQSCMLNACSLSSFSSRGQYVVLLEDVCRVLYR